MTYLRARPSDHLAAKRFREGIAKERALGIHPKYRKRRSQWPPALHRQYENAVKAWDTALLRPEKSV